MTTEGNVDIRWSTIPGKVNRGPSTMDYRLWTIDYQLIAVVRRPWTVDYGLLTMDYQLIAVVRRPWTMVY